MEYTKDICYRFSGSTLWLWPAGGGSTSELPSVSNQDILKRLSRRYADLLDSWVNLAETEPLPRFACALAYRGELLQWSAYVSAWWFSLLELLEERTGQKIADLRAIRTGQSDLVQDYLLQNILGQVRARPGRPASPAIIPSLLLGLILTAGYGTALAEYFWAWIRLRRLGRPFKSHGAALILVFAQIDNTTKHVYEWVRSLPTHTYTPYVLGSPLRALRERPEWADSSLPTFGEVWSGLWLGMKSLSAYSQVARTSSCFVLYGGAVAWRQAFFAGARLLRQGVHQARLGRCPSLPGMALFALQTTEGILLDSYFEYRGVKSVHWLHGTLSNRRHLDGISSLAIAKSTVDAEELRATGHYKKVLNGQRSNIQIRIPVFSAQPEGKDGKLLVLSTQFHPARIPPDDVKLAELVTFLEIVSALAQALDCKVTWRPHPREVKAMCVEKIRNQVDMTLITVDYQTPIDLQIREARQIFATMSGALLDVFEQGRVPAVYSGAFFEQIGTTRALPDRILFGDKTEALLVLKELSDPVRQRQLFDQIMSEIAFDRGYTPSGITFNELEAG